MVIKATPPHDVFLNDRVWAYRRDPRRRSAGGGADLRGDCRRPGRGRRHRALRRRRQAGSRAGAASGGDWRSERLAPVDRRCRCAARAGRYQRRRPPRAAGDSRDEAWAVHELAARGRRARPWPPRVARFAAPGGWTVAHLDPGRGPSVVGMSADGVPVIWRPGPGRHGYLSLGFSGRDPVERSAPIQCLWHWRHASPCAPDRGGPLSIPRAWRPDLARACSR